MNRDIDYDFTDGRLEFSSYEWTGIDGVHSCFDGEYMIDEGPDRAERRYLQREMAKTTQRLMAHDESGAVEVCHLNTDADPSRGCVVYNMGIGDNFHHPIGRQEVIARAAADPAMPICVINNAGSGNSTVAPRHVMRDMKQSGSFRSQGTWLASTLTQTLEDYGGTVHIEGNSAGARQGLSLGAALGAYDDYHVPYIRVVDPPGAKDHSTAGVVARFMSQTGPSKSYAARSPYNPYHNGVLANDEKQAPNLMTNVRALVDNGWNYPAAMKSQAGFVTDLHDASLAIIPGGDLTVMQPEHSEFARLQSMQTALALTAFGLSARHETLLLSMTVRHHTHAIMSAGAGANPVVSLYGMAAQEVTRRHNVTDGS